VKFVIMNSVFDTDKMLSSFYDLKGSVLGRVAKTGDSVLKDNDLRKNLAEAGIRLPEKVRERMREQVRRDCTFLKEMKIMDYSMLVGIHYTPAKNSNNPDISGLLFRGLNNSIRKPAPLERSRSDSGVILSPESAAFLRRTSSDHRKHARTRTAESFTTMRSPGDEEKKGTQTERRVDDSFDFRMSTQNEKSSCFPQFTRSPFSPKTNAAFTPNTHEESKKIFDQSITSPSTIGYDDEDDTSLLEGPRHSSYFVDLKSPGSDDTTDEDWVKEREKIDRRRELAIEQNYWPFHRHYELNGDRRIIPIKSKSINVVEEIPNNSTEADLGCSSTCFGDPSAYDPDLNTLREKLTLDDFVSPISSRRDGGLVMELSGLTLPLKVTTGGKTQECDGKIYYMGIIDILQQFNVRKRLEARLRKIRGGERCASCVHPVVYADRFVSFFDEYTLAIKAKSADDALDQDGGSEEIVFEPTKRTKID